MRTGGICRECVAACPLSAARNFKEKVAAFVDTEDYILEAVNLGAGNASLHSCYNPERGKIEAFCSNSIRFSLKSTLLRVCCGVVSFVDALGKNKLAIPTEYYDSAKYLRNSQQSRTGWAGVLLATNAVRFSEPIVSNSQLMLGNYPVRDFLRGTEDKKDNRMLWINPIVAATGLVLGAKFNLISPK